VTAAVAAQRAARYARSLQRIGSGEVRRVTVRKSSVHGRGVFALQAIPAGQRIFECRGEVTSWRRASARYRRSGVPGHAFGLADGRVIDGSVGGNSARWLNHSCQPNCEAIEDERGGLLSGRSTT
jgi:Proteins containing SET domain